MDKKVEVYSSPTCPFCTQVKDFLKENNIDFKEINILEKEENRAELTERSGQAHIPVTFVDEEMIIGFDEDALKKALGL